MLYTLPYRNCQLLDIDNWHLIKLLCRPSLRRFVMSGGVLRPKNCSMPDERLLVQCCGKVFSCAERRLFSSMVTDNSRCGFFNHEDLPSTQNIFQQPISRYVLWSYMILYHILYNQNLPTMYYTLDLCNIRCTNSKTGSHVGVSMSGTAEIS